MPTRTELIPCPECGVPRPIRGNHAKRTAAALARCWACVTQEWEQTRYIPQTVLIACPDCGTPRPVKLSRGTPYELKTTKQRKCRKCAQPTTGFQPRIEHIPCVECGNPRPIKVNGPYEIKTAEQRPCLTCSTRSNDIDEMAVERLIAGRPVQATPAERREAVAYLTRRKQSARAIAERIGCTKRTVERHRSKLAS